LEEEEMRDCCGALLNTARSIVARLSTTLGEDANDEPEEASQSSDENENVSWKEAKNPKKNTDTT
jgi:hypothetical protein